MDDKAFIEEVELIIKRNNINFSLTKNTIRKDIRNILELYNIPKAEITVDRFDDINYVHLFYATNLNFKPYALCVLFKNNLYSSKIYDMDIDNTLFTEFINNFVKDFSLRVRQEKIKTLLKINNI